MQESSQRSCCCGCGCGGVACIENVQRCVYIVKYEAAGAASAVAVVRGCVCVVHRVCLFLCVMFVFVIV